MQAGLSDHLAAVASQEREELQVLAEAGAEVLHWMLVVAEEVVAGLLRPLRLVQEAAVAEEGHLRPHHLELAVVAAGLGPRKRQALLLVVAAAPVVQQQLQPCLQFF